jgi:hypothetical integral membrane protein (TIGR02206 family)
VIAAFLVAGRRGGETELRARALLTFINLAAYAMSQAARGMATRGQDLDNLVPLHLCDIASFMAGFALITRHPTLAALTYFWGLAGTIQGVLTPALDIGFPHPVAWAFFIHHFAVIGAALYLPVVMGWRAEGAIWKSPLKAMAWLNVYVAVALIANGVLGTNFGFLSHKPLNPSLLDHLGPHPWYILVLEGIALVFFLLLVLPVRERRRA